MKLLIVIVNYRTAALTVDCLQSLTAEGTPLAALRTVVVDNASGDDSPARIRAAVAEHGWTDWVEVVEAPRNGGFAYGNNFAIAPALASADPPEFVLLLNSDTVVRPGAVQTLVRFLESRPDVGIVGSRLEDPDGTPQCSAFRFPTIRSELAEAVNLGAVNRLLRRHIILPGIPDETCAMPWVAGASMLVRREVFDAVGLLDDEYFLYYEEVDFCLRAARAGFPCWYEPASRVVHLVGQSSGVTERNTRPKRRPRYWFDSRRRYFVKNHGRLYAAAVDVVWSVGYAVRRTLDLVRRRPNLDPPQLLTDYLRHAFKNFLVWSPLPGNPHRHAIADVSGERVRERGDDRSSPIAPHPNPLPAAASAGGSASQAGRGDQTGRKLGVVAIGRNEGARLERCLASVVGRAAATVYVDSGSTDGSVDAARRLGADVVALDLSTPFTAARARNEGFARLCELLPDVEFVQFVDGDCEVDAAWLTTGLAALAADETLAVVCGRRRERFPKATVFNRLCDLEWDTPIGEALACGGDAMFRAAAFRAVGGFDATLIAGEEPELCVRLRERGLHIRRLPAEMTLHDAAMTRFGQWWRRSVRAGHAYAEGAALHGAPPERHWVREVRSNWLWGVGIPSLAVGLAWPTHGWSLLLLILFVVQAWRVWRHGRRRAWPAADARAYALFTVLGKFPMAVGQLQYIVGRLVGRRSRLIEYKGVAT